MKTYIITILALVFLAIGVANSFAFSTTITKKVKTSKNEDSFEIEFDCYMLVEKNIFGSMFRIRVGPLDSPLASQQFEYFLCEEQKSTLWGTTFYKCENENPSSKKPESMQFEWRFLGGKRGVCEYFVEKMYKDDFHSFEDP